MTAPVRRLLPSKASTYVSLISSSISVILAAFAFLRSRSTQYGIASDEFHTAAITTFTQLEAGIILSLLPAELCTSYLISNSSITRSSFRRFVSDSPAFFRNSSLQAISVVPRVQGPSERMDWEAEGRQYLSTFRITERNASNSLVTAANRSEYYVVQWIEPYVGNEAALGFDLYSNPTRQGAIDIVKLRGVPTMTERITLVQSTKSQFGSLYFVPFFYVNDSSWGTPIGASGPRPGRTVAFTGTANLGGFTSAVFKLDEVLYNALKSLTLADVDIFLFDRTPPLDATKPSQSGLSLPNNSFLAAYINPSGNVSSPYQNTSFNEFQSLVLESVISDLTSTKDLLVGDRIWTITVSARPGYFAQRGSVLLPTLFLVCSLLEPVAMYSFLLIVVAWELQRVDWKNNVSRPIARRFTIPSTLMQSRRSNIGQGSITNEGSKKNTLSRRKEGDGSSVAPQIAGTAGLEAGSMTQYL